jgi:hypothetical protein
VQSDQDLSAERENMANLNTSRSWPFNYTAPQDMIIKGKEELQTRQTLERVIQILKELIHEKRRSLKESHEENSRLHTKTEQLKKQMRRTEERAQTLSDDVLEHKAIIQQKERELEQCKNSNSAQAAAILQLQKELTTSRKLLEASSDTLVIENLELRRQIIKLRQDTEMEAEQCESKYRQMKTQSDFADAILRMGITPRSLLILDVNQGRASNRVVSDMSLLHDDLQRLFHGDASLETLDNPLTLEAAIGILNEFVETSYLASYSVALQRCSVCQTVKFVSIGDSSTGTTMSEYLPSFSQTPCCKQFVCASCLSDMLVTAIRNDWSNNIRIDTGSEDWLRCPFPLCRSPEIGVEMESKIDEVIFDYFQHPHVDEGIPRSIDMLLDITTKYSRARMLRASLQLATDLTEEGIATGQLLHAQLAVRGLAHDILDLECATFQMDRSDGVDEAVLVDTMLPPMICDIDGLKVPLWTRCLKRRETPKECNICADCFFELDIPSHEDWHRACEGFEGSWMWKVQAFPHLQLCDHPFGSCKKCIARHLATQLEQYGRSGCDRMTCPDCNRKLEDDEIRLLADKDTVNKYVPVIYDELHTNYIMQTRAFPPHQPSFYRSKLPLVSQREMRKRDALRRRCRQRNYHMLRMQTGDVLLLPGSIPPGFNVRRVSKSEGLRGPQLPGNERLHQKQDEAMSWTEMWCANYEGRVVFPHDL